MSFITVLTDLLFPKKCFGCNNIGIYLCARCRKTISSYTQKCVYCRKASYLGLTHPGCRKRYGLDGLYSFYHYSNLVKKVVSNIKYRLVKDAIKEIMRTTPLSFIEKIPQIRHILDNPILIPVPLHANRLKKRGFNQAAIMGSYLASRMNIPLEESLVLRIKDTSPQAKLKDYKSRRINMKGAFDLKMGVNLDNKNIILFDDVFTTGSTIFEIVKLLKQNNVKKIYAITFASS